MRWNASERAVGYLAALVTLIAGAAWADGLETAARRVRPGMTREEVAAALGATDCRSRTRFGPAFCVLIPPGPQSREAQLYRDDVIRAFAARNTDRFREYQLFLCVVDVEFDPVHRAESVVAHRSMTTAWFQTPWPVAAVLVGLISAEVSRRRRLAAAVAE